MRIGDWIDDYKARSWTILGVSELSRVCPDFRSGKYVLMAAARAYPTALPEHDWELIARLEHEDDVRAHWKRGPTFVVGQTITSYRWLGDDVRIHVLTDNLVTLIDKDGELFADWRWHLSMRAALRTHIDFSHAAYSDRHVREDHLGEAA